MNTYETAELAAELSRRGLAQQIIIRHKATTTNAIANQTPTGWMQNAITLIWDGPDNIASIKATGGAYIAAGRKQFAFGITRAQALAALMDNPTWNSHIARHDGHDNPCPSSSSCLPPSA